MEHRDKTADIEIKATRARNPLCDCSPDGPGEGGSEKSDAASQKGLCSICEGCEACAFPKPEGGVWHCEEYR